MNYILLGLKGCGKTYFGKKFSKYLGYPFIDTDMALVNLHQQCYGEQLDVRAIYQKKGALKFRLLEEKVIRLLVVCKNTVISLGGGTLLSPANRAILSSLGKAIYLRTKLTTLKHRGLQDGLPAFLSDFSDFEAMYRQRAALCTAFTNCIIDSDRKTAFSELKRIHTHGK